MLEVLFSTFVLKTITAGLGLCCVTGPLGSILIWRRMSYFGDTLAHSALLGLVLAALLNLNSYIGLIVIFLLVSVLLKFISNHKIISKDTILGILSHTVLAMGILMLSKSPHIRANLLSYFFGDILSVQNADLILIWISIIPILGIIKIYWTSIVSSIVSEEIAFCEKVNTKLMEKLIIVLIAVVFAISIKIVGMLLINSLLIIPAATARMFTFSPEKMALVASFLGMIGVTLGICISFIYDLPVGATIICSLTSMFALAILYNLYRRGYN